MAMTRSFRTAWYAACTSGRFRQVKAELVDYGDDTKRCCLGVARAVGREMGILTGEDYRSNENEEAYLTKDDQFKLGIENQHPFAEANDGCPAPEGQYYPDEVLELIKNYPVIADKHD